MNLSDVPTPWSKLSRDERSVLLDLYAVPIRKRVGELLQKFQGTEDKSFGDQVAQDLVIKFIERGFPDPRAADEIASNKTQHEKRFRRYLSTVIRNAVVDALDRQGRELGRRVSPDLSTIAAEEDDPNSFTKHCRDAIVKHVAAVVQALLADQTFSRRSLRELLRALISRSEETPTDDPSFLDTLSRLTGRAWRDDTQRRVLGRLRRRFAELLVTEVRRTLDPEATQTDLDGELAELGFLNFVRRWLCSEPGTTEAEELEE